VLKQITEWNTVRKIWMIGETDLFSQQFKPFSGRWPISGMMRNGVVYELPMQELHTTVLESLSSPTQVLGTPTTATSGRSAEFRKGSNPNPVEFVEDLLASGLLPTPNTMEHREIKTPAQIAELKLRSPGGYRNLRETVVNELPEPELLRTPSVTDSTGGAISEKQARERGRMVKVADQVAELAAVNGLQVSPSIANSLLPTPKALDGVKGNLKTSQERLDSGHQVDLPNVAIDLVPQTDWGKFEPAIRRWEELTRPAPAPTKPDGKDGNHRLSAEFTEWMMGLPEGWVTADDLGLKRNDQLKACGNGVVPQQAELALKLLLQDVKI